MYKILIVEDDMMIAKTLSSHLEKWDYEVRYVKDFKNVMNDFLEFDPQLVLMDIILPLFNGFHWCTEIRKIAKTPIVFLSSASDNMNIVMAMNMGGDDFIEKPFDLNVVTAKVQAMLRRAYSFQGNLNVLEHQGLLLNLNDGIVSYKEKKTELTKNEFKILQVLMEHAGKIVTREELMTALWESDAFVDDNTLTVNVTRLRRKLAELAAVEFIKTKKGIGIYYRDMKEFRSYWKKNKRWIGISFSFAVIFTVILMLYDISADTVWYAFALCFSVEVILLAVDFVKYYGKCKRMEEQYLNINICVPEDGEPEDLVERYYQEMVNTLFEGKAKIESDNNIARKEMLDYYSLWVHQIKTPIAAMRILLQAAEEISFEKRTELEMELFKIEQYVEMALSYIRLGNMASDLKLQWYPMDEIIKPAVKKYSKLFILKKIKLKYEPIENKILTDEKWLGLVVEQILSNALKYTNEGTISIYLEPKKENVLVIEDTGIGIWQEDLPRVFEKGFTGYNGRTDKKSTGIGLYLCKSIVDKLNHRIYISSEVSKGTKIFLNLNRDDFRLE